MLTKEEQALAANAQILLTKNKVIQEVYALFGRLAESYLPLTTFLPEEVVKMHAKISKGENYLGLPWVILDYPRHFAGKNTFAIRTMFWWGHYFSLHLLLQGSYMQMFNRDSIAQYDNWYFSIAEDPWQHQFDESSILPLNLIDSSTMESQKESNFYKISCYLPLSEWERAETFLFEKCKEALSFVKV